MKESWATSDEKKAGRRDIHVAHIKVPLHARLRFQSRKDHLETTPDRVRKVSTASNVVIRADMSDVTNNACLIRAEDEEVDRPMRG